MKITQRFESILDCGPIPATLRASLTPWFFISLGLAYGLSVFFRLYELPMWMGDEFFAAGERILATHDGYAFLAGVNGTSRYLNEPLVAIIAFVHGVSGISLGNLGFWMPVFFAGLAALPVCLVAARLGRSEAGAMAGIVTVCCFGFLIRSRLGYFDTDMLTLFFAVGTAAGFILWLAPLCRSGWIAADGDLPQRPLHQVLLGAVCLGIFMILYHKYYPSGMPIMLSLFGVAFVVGLVLAKNGERVGIFMGLALILGCLQFGWVGTVVGLGVVVIAWRSPDLLLTRHLGLVAAGVFLIAAALSFLAPMILKYLNRVLVYFNPTAQEVATDIVSGGLNLPSAISSVREASKKEFSQSLQLVAGTPWLFWLAFAAYVWTAIRRPLVLLLVPLLGLALASSALGTRFTMYGGAALGIGLGFAVSDLAGLVRRRSVAIVLQGVLICVVSLGLFLPIPSLRPKPVLSRPMAEAYIELRDVAAKDAILWQWWDYGYAAQYFGQRDTWGDGGRHSGDWLFPLALAHASTSVSQSAQVIRYMGWSWARQVDEAIAAGIKPYPPAKVDFFGIDPAHELAAMGGAKSMDLLGRLKTERLELEGSVPEQYLMVTWQNLSYAGWISGYGNWDLVSGEGLRGKSSPLPGGAIDFTQGIVQSRKGQRAQLSGVDLVDQNGKIRKLSWMRFGAPYAVANMQTHEMYLMDSRVNNAMMVRMLFDKPSEFEPYFTLVVDKAPACRIFRVNP